MTMAEPEINIRLEGGGPWGFRLTGGKDFGSRLTVSKITPGGKASYNGVREHDQIFSINYEDTRNMTHMDAQEAIKQAGSTLDLSIRRGDSPKTGRGPLTMTETVHSGKVDHKYNAVPKPFGAAPSFQPSRQTAPPPSAPQAAPTVRSGPPPTAPKPSSPMAPAYSHYTGGPARSNNAPPPGRDYIDSDAAMRAKKKEIEDEMLSQRFKLSISDDGEVNYDEASQVPNWGHPPDPNVQSKSFKMLQRHLQQHDDDDLPPPPPEAYDDQDEEKVQSKSFQMLRSAVDSGESPPSVFNRDRGDRSKPSTTPMPNRPTVPITKSTPETYAPPPMSRPGQAPPVALPGMGRQDPSAQSSQPKIRTQRPQAPSYQHPSHPPSAPQPPRGPPQGGGHQHEIKRQPIKPPQPADGSRTPYCDACGQEIFGPFVSAIGRSWHPDHFTCAGCGESLQNQGFIEEGGKLYCEKDYNKHFAPQCNTCKQPIIGPRSLHACIFPKSTSKSSVPVPSSDMLKAIREGQATAKLPRKPKINPSLFTHKKSLSESNDFGKVHFPVHGIDYMTRRDSSHSRSRTSSTGSSDSGNVFRSESSSDQWEPLVSPKAVKEFERIHAEMTYAEPGSGSMKDKVKQLKEQVQDAFQQEKDAKEAKELAAQRFKKNKILAKELKWRIQDAEDKLQRLETKVENTRGRLHERSRIVQESIGNKKRAENVTKENVREKENIQYEIVEVNAARDSALSRLREVSRRLAVKQAAVQNAEDRFNAMKARSKRLSDMKEMYKLRINNIHSKSSQLAMRNEKQVHRIHIVEDSIAECTERFKRAEKMMLPLKIYLNQLQDAAMEEKSNTRRLSYELAAYQQRLRTARHYTDF